MGNLRKSLDKLKFDQRMVDWNYTEGLLTKEEYRKHLESLPDMAHKAVELTLEEEANGADGDSHFNNSHN
ncbi:MAG: hypothetical protein IPJ71_11760 [Bdellovibrionales bacterium]|nr:hypothetical protein [Bdellovibrionales bacterium]